MNDFPGGPCLFTISADRSTVPSLSEKLGNNAGVIGKGNAKYSINKICPNSNLCTKNHTLTALHYYVFKYMPVLHPLI
jgi:hypothetical protein